MKKIPIPKLIIFDCDGVLVDSEKLANQELVMALARHGLDISFEEAVQSFAGFAPEDTVAKAETMLGRALPQDFWSKTQERTFAAFERDLQPIKGAADLVWALKENDIRVCVASSGTHEKMNLTLKLTGLDGLFRPNVFSAADVGRGKPAPDLFLFAARQMETAPSDCLVIEDSRPGIEAARTAGMDVIFLDSNERKDTEFQGVTRITALDHVQDLLQ